MYVNSTLIDLFTHTGALLYLASYVKDLVTEFLNTVTTFAADNGAIHNLLIP